eukprot:scaffold1146_cov399-Prasinococcus_capsulatus_cf.AAC.12
MLRVGRALAALAVALSVCVCTTVGGSTSPNDTLLAQPGRHRQVQDSLYIPRHPSNRTDRVEGDRWIAAEQKRPLRSLLGHGHRMYVCALALGSVAGDS